MPSLKNKKVCLVTNDVSNAICSTELIVLRKKPAAEINIFYLFRALRSDHLTRQAETNVTEATGKQRINPTKLLELKIIVPPPELQDRIGEATEKEFLLRTLASEQTILTDDESKPVLGSTTIRTQQ